MYKINGEYWIIDGRADFADGDLGDKNHEMIAMDHICSKNLEQIYSCAKELRLNIPSLISMEDDEPTEAVQSLLPLIFEKLKSWNEVEKECGVDVETLKTIMDRNSDPRFYVMKRYGWVAVRSNNIELYNLNQKKLKELSSGLDDIVEQEYSGEDINDEELEFSLYDYLTNKSTDLTLQDIKDNSVFRPKTIPQTTYNRLAMPVARGKLYGRELWRGTSENVNFKNWLNLFENFQLNENKHMQNNSAACGHCKKSLKVVDIIIGKHMFPIGQLFECVCKKSKVFTNTIRNIENLMNYIDGNRSTYSNGFCNDKKCGKCFSYITPLLNGVDVPEDIELNTHDVAADRYGCMKCPENQNILIVGQAFLPEGDKTSSYFIYFYTKHKDKIENLYEKLKGNL